MGYYSDVGIKCGEKAYQKFADAYRKVGLPPTQLFKNNYGEYLIIWEWVEWRNDLPDVQAIQSVMNELCCGKEAYKDPDYGFKFIRLGENDDDVEVIENDGDIEFYYVRQFDTDGMSLVSEGT